MTREDIIRMAREAGIPETATEGVFIANSDDLGRLIEAEREACSEIADQHRNNMQFLASNPPQSAAAYDIAKAIRARGQG